MTTKHTTTRRGAPGPSGLALRPGLRVRLTAIALCLSLLTGCTMIWQAGEELGDKIQQLGEDIAGLVFDAAKLPTRVAHWAPMILKAGSVCPEAPPELIAAQLMQESTFGLNQHSPAGALGPAQFMPATWATHAVDGDRDGDRDIMDPADAIASQAAYDCEIAAMVRPIGGDTRSLMLAGYNAGPGVVQSLGRIPRITETQDYVRLILSMMRNYTKPGATGPGRAGAEAVIAAAMDFVRRKVPYAYGGESRNSVDCSGLTQYVFKTVGVDLRRTAQQQFDQFPEIPVSQVRPGDLVAFDLRDRKNGGGDRQHIDHIGLVSSVALDTSTGKPRIEMIQAPRTGDHVKVSPVTSDFYAKFNAFYVRVLDGGQDGTAASPTTWGLPVDARYSPTYKRVSARYANYHRGVDFPAASGTPIRAVGSGTVVKSGWGGAYGNEIVIRHADGKYTQYGHMQAPSRFKEGDRVRTGQEIGNVGTTGNSTGPHLHFEARTGPAYGSDIDPIRYLRSKGLSPEANEAKA